MNGERPRAEERPCPACGEPILAVARRCKHCHASIAAAREASPVSQPLPTWGTPASPVPEPIPAAWLPRSFAIVALLAGVLGSFLHFSSIEPGSRAAPLHGQPLRGVRGSEAIWTWMDAVSDWLAVVLVSGGVLCGLLVLLSYPLWTRRWWARRALLVWGGLVIATFCFEAVMAAQVVTALGVAERQLIQGLGGDWLAIPAVGTWAGRVLVALNSATLAEQASIMTFFQGIYFLIAGTFPFLALVALGRPGAARYFNRRRREGKGREARAGTSVGV